jgi:hypothetical protein
MKGSPIVTNKWRPTQNIGQTIDEGLYLNGFFTRHWFTKNIMGWFDSFGQLCLIRKGFFFC